MGATSRLRILVCRNLYSARDKVQVNFKGAGRYYPGTIQAKNSQTCTYNIVYDDGDRETNVPEIRIKPECSYNVGAKVLGNWASYGKYYSGAVTAKSGNTYTIRYFDGTTENNVPCKRIRDGASCARELTGIYRMGARVQGNFEARGRWYDAVISGCSGNGNFD